MYWILAFIAVLRLKRKNVKLCVKMFWKQLVCVFLMLGLVMCDEIKGFIQNGAYQADSRPYYEIPCLVFGGICLPSKECPEGREASVNGLCPTQQKKGVECCHSVSASETRCRMRGGECMPKSRRCPERLTFGTATDCANEEKCCILV